MKLVKRITALALAFLMVATVFAEQALPARAATQADIDKLKQQAAEIASNKKELQAEIDRLKKEAKDATAEKAALDQRNDAIRAELENAEAQIQKYDELIAQTKTELEQVRQEEEAQRELFNSRVRAMEENGTISYLEVLFNAASFSDLLSTLDDVGEVMEADQRIFNEMRELRKTIEEKEMTLEECLAEAQEQKTLLEERRKELQAEINEAAAMIAEISKDKEGYMALLKAEEAEAKSISSEIKRIQLELANQGKLPAATYGGYIWPVSNGSRRITSPFGPRNNPVTGRYQNHNGIDIGGVYYSTQVIAAKAGTVIVSQKGSSYGNYVVVSHGTGNTTLYAHLSSRAVSVGDVVAQGDVLGITGSTGNSTGPHLHFEITENGSRIDPLTYLKDYVKAW